MIPTTSACGHLQYHGLISTLEGFGNDTPVHEIISTNAAESGNWPAKIERLIARSMNHNADGDPTDIASYLYLLRTCRFSKPHAIRKVINNFQLQPRLKVSHHLITTTYHGNLLYTKEPTLDSLQGISEPSVPTVLL